MSRPVVVNDAERQDVKNENSANEKPKKTGVRPEVAKLINKVVRENAPTWKALAKR